MPAKKTDDSSLKRLGGGRWQTHDERFTIEPQSGTWSLVDAEQTDDLGLPLVRGPFRSLTDAKAAITTARESAAPASPLKGRVAPPKKAPGAAKAAPERPVTKAAPAKDEPREAAWIAELGPDARRRARRLIERLEATGVRDPEGIVRRDLAGGVPTVPRVALADRLAAAFDADQDDAVAGILEVLADGRDEALDVRWRLVDDDGRPIGLSARDLEAARERKQQRGKERRG
jgi:hypothetical protein